MAWGLSSARLDPRPSRPPEGSGAAAGPGSRGGGRRVRHGVRPRLRRPRRSEAAPLERDLAGARRRGRGAGARRRRRVEQHRASRAESVPVVRPRADQGLPLGEHQPGRLDLVDVDLPGPSATSSTAEARSATLSCDPNQSTTERSRSSFGRTSRSSKTSPSDCAIEARMRLWGRSHWSVTTVRTESYARAATGILAPLIYIALLNRNSHRGAYNRKKNIVNLLTGTAPLNKHWSSSSRISACLI